MQHIDTIKISNPVQSSHKKSRGNTYEILTCPNEMVCFDDLVSGKYRSIVCDPETHHIRSYSPPKSLELANFIKTYPDFGTTFLSEIVEGTMINLFYDPKAGVWEIATRGSVGGNYWYNRTHYSAEKTGSNQKTFCEMFVEALHESRDTPLNELPGLAYLDRGYSYSFVLQHPDNHMVYTIKTPSVTLVAIYEIKNVDVNGEECVFSSSNQEEYAWNTPPSIRYVSPAENTIWNQAIGALVCKPLTILHVSSYSDFEQLDKTPDIIQTPGTHLIPNIYRPMGWMLTHSITGDRVAKENPHYARLKELRGNNPNLQYHYLSLYRINKVSEFLVWFPMYKKQFYEFYTQYHSFITEIHNAYVAYYVHKSTSLIAKKYFIHASRIHHQIYLPSLKEQKIVITHRVIRDYVDKMTPAKILYYLRYEDKNALENAAE